MHCIHGYICVCLYLQSYDDKDFYCVKIWLHIMKQKVLYFEGFRFTIANFICGISLVPQFPQVRHIYSGYVYCNEADNPCAFQGQLPLNHLLLTGEETR